MRYILHPGWEVSRDTSKRIYRNALDLLLLYFPPEESSLNRVPKLPPFIVVYKEDPKPSPLEGDVHLYPNHEREYPLNRIRKELK